MQSSSQGQGRYGYAGYQGYPYVNPMVTDVPTIDAETASRWANLPRRPMQGGSAVVGAASSASRTVNSSQAAPSRTDETVPPKQDPDVNPVVYIDLPEAGSEVSRSIESPGDVEPEFVQDTIMYDPFENRRIDVPKDDTRSIMSSDSESSYHPPARPAIRPDTLNLVGAGSSTPQPGTSRQTPGLPSFMSKESQVYGGDGADGFPLSPIPISEFPEPPPAYTEMSPQVATPRETPIVEPLRVETPQGPRTQVILPKPPSPVIASSPVGAQNYDRKYLICHHCGSRVYTLVVRENGALTHMIACIIFFLFFPFLICVYCLDFFKYKNHYCPNCNKLIGYETPIVGEKVNYVT
ncbi:uncharacterized protein LOC110382961 [Helicoverpa armigera]|uniref:uncharacterized protein LOC110382961 n=1 Tax=Helicoverpa armigera TaxID=29058 RepID=UPI003082F708